LLAICARLGYDFSLAYRLTTSANFYAMIDTHPFFARGSANMAAPNERRLHRIVTAACLLVCGMTLTAHAQDWTRFRGPNGSGRAPATAAIPSLWTDSDFNWSIELPGEGHSSPVVWGERLFLTTADEETNTRIVMAIDTANGETLWQRDYPLTVHSKHLRNTFASPTPAVDADHVYVSWSTLEEYTLIALDHEGEKVWRRDLGTFASKHSAGPSPSVYEDMVILPNYQSDRIDEVEGVSSIVAVDRTTGEDRWEIPGGTKFVSYATPCVYRPDDGPPQMIFCSTADGMISVDPRDGSVNWRIDVFTPRTVSSPQLAGDLILGTAGSGGGGNYLVAIRPAGSEAASEPSVAYTIDRSAPYVPTPIVIGPNAYLWSDGGVLSCVVAASGELLWRERVGGNYSGSPVAVGDRLFCISDDGDVVVVNVAGGEYDPLGSNSLAELSRSTPAVSDDVMYLRTVSHLYSIGGE
jgi:outer membrane protein assembly factor BamB